MKLLLFLFFEQKKHLFIFNKIKNEKKDLIETVYY
jgi:hypothetical protein